MLFNSWEYAIFLPLVFVIYWLVLDYALKHSPRQLLWQNLFVVAASYLFYGWWNWRFLILIAFTSLCSWGSGLLINRSSKPKLWLTLNIVVNLLILGMFKYYNFFVDSFCTLFGLTNSLALQVILPVGISFYTFQALSYSIDVYRKKIAPTLDVVAFFAYVSFFPQLVAGPIERATNLLPQFEKKRVFDYTQAVDGLKKILWGVFKKMVVADSCAIYVDRIWSNYTGESANSLLLAAVLFAFQIYGDFSGYSDIAIGSAKLFGIYLKDNFLTPYFSRNVAEFWKRWHISLNTWFVDYVYIPLGGSHEGKLRTITNTFAIFLLSGLWHGANWTYITWGLYHALLFIPLILMGRTKAYQGRATGHQLPQVILTFALVTLGWIIFRAPSLADAWMYMCGMCDKSLLTVPYIIEKAYIIPTVACLILMLLVEWFRPVNIPKFVRWLAYIGLCVVIYAFGNFSYTQFIYFQF